jgi:hypothetical protein
MLMHLDLLKLVVDEYWMYKLDRLWVCWIVRNVVPFSPAYWIYPTSWNYQIWSAWSEQCNSFPCSPAYRVPTLDRNTLHTDLTFHVYKPILLTSIILRQSNSLRKCAYSLLWTQCSPAYSSLTIHSTHTMRSTTLTSSPDRISWISVPSPNLPLMSIPRAFCRARMDVVTLISRWMLSHSYPDGCCHTHIHGDEAWMDAHSTWDSVCKTWCNALILPKVPYVK